MEKKVAFTEKGIRIGGKDYPMYGGAFHYWRTEPAYWETALKNIKAMGIDIIETYIPWDVHEPEENQFDFGEKDPRKDLNRFIRECERAGLYLMVRPGPHINAEMNRFGYPEWLLEDERVQAKTPLGTPVVYPYVTKQYRLPSYASDLFYEKTERYFSQIAPILQKSCYPDGPVIAIQVDNETCNFFRDTPYIMDYSGASARLFFHFLEEKYRTIDKLNEMYYTDYKRFDEVRLPDHYEEGDEILEPYFDWAEYKEYQILESLKRMIGILDRMKLPIPYFHNCAYQNYTPISLQRDERLEGLEVAGLDAYADPGETGLLKERMRFLAGSSRLPFVPEFGSGSYFDRGIVLTPQEEEFGYLYSLMNGLKAISFYMLVERDKWTGCPLRNDGSARKEYYDMFARMLSVMKAERLNEYTRRPEVLILKNYEMGRARALMTKRDRNLFSSNCFINGTDIPGALFAPEQYPSLYIDRTEGPYYREKWNEELCAVLDRLGIDYDISDEYIPDGKLQSYRYVFAYSCGWMNEEYQRMLAAWSEGAGHHLCVGPDVPHTDRTGRDCRYLEEHGRWIRLRTPGAACSALEKPQAAGSVLEEPQAAGSVLEEPQAAGSVFGEPQTVGSILADIQLKVRSSDPQIEVSVHELPGAGECVVYAANVSGEVKEAVLTFDQNYRIRGIYNDTAAASGNGIKVRMEPMSIKIWKLSQHGTNEHQNLEAQSAWNQ